MIGYLSVLWDHHATSKSPINGVLPWNTDLAPSIIVINLALSAFIVRCVVFTKIAYEDQIMEEEMPLCALGGTSLRPQG